MRKNPFASRSFPQCFVAMNQIDLSNRNAVVTGGASGIGFAISQRLLQSGASVCLWDVDTAAAAEALVRPAFAAPENNRCG